MKKSSNMSQKHIVLANKDAPRGDFMGLDKLSYLISVCRKHCHSCYSGIIISNLIDVIGAKLFNKPIAAGTEIVYFLQVIAIAVRLPLPKSMVSISGWSLWTAYRKG